jgi:hypothetical protein
MEVTITQDMDQSIFSLSEILLMLRSIGLGVAKKIMGTGVEALTRRSRMQSGKLGSQVKLDKEMYSS